MGGQREAFAFLFVWETASFRVTRPKVEKYSM